MSTARGVPCVCVACACVCLCLRGFVRRGCLFGTPLAQSVLGLPPDRRRLNALGVLKTTNGEARLRAVLHLAVAHWSTNGTGVGDGGTACHFRRARTPLRRPRSAAGASSSVLRGVVTSHPPTTAGTGPAHTAVAATTATAAAATGAAAAELLRVSEAPSHGLPGHLAACRPCEGSQAASAPTRVARRWRRGWRWRRRRRRWR